MDGFCVDPQGNRRCTVRSMVEDWHTRLLAVPHELMHAALGISTQLEGVYSKAALKIMRAQGWKRGTGLGKHATGTLEAPKAQTGSSHGEGLGYNTASRQKKPELLALSWQEDGHERVVYGYRGHPDREGQATFRPVRITPLGRPTSSDAPPPVTIQNDQVLHKVLWWGNAIMGIAEATFPNPEAWTLEGLPDACTLAKATTRLLTMALTSRRACTPTCIQAWGDRINTPAHTYNPNNVVHAHTTLYIGLEDVPRQLKLTLKLGNQQECHSLPRPLPMLLVGSSLHAMGVLTIRDMFSYYKNILHRTLLTHHVKPVPILGRKCRLCKTCEETIIHLCFCRCVMPIWDRFLALTRHYHPGATPTQQAPDTIPS